MEFAKYSDEIYDKIDDLYTQNTKIYIAMLATCLTLNDNTSKDMLQKWALRDIDIINGWLNITYQKRLDNYWGSSVKQIAEDILRDDTSHKYVNLAESIYNELKEKYDKLGYGYAVYVGWTNSPRFNKAGNTIMGTESVYDYIILRGWKGEGHSTCSYLDDLQASRRMQLDWCAKNGNSGWQTQDLHVFQDDMKYHCGDLNHLLIAKTKILMSPDNLRWGYFYDKEVFAADLMTSMSYEVVFFKVRIEECYGVLDLIYIKKQK